MKAIAKDRKSQRITFFTMQPSVLVQFSILSVRRKTNEIFLRHLTNAQQHVQEMKIIVGINTQIELGSRERND